MLIPQSFVSLAGLNLGLDHLDLIDLLLCTQPDMNDLSISGGALL
jgi:hypothetical protein